MLTYRLITGLAAAAALGFGFVYRAVVPGVNDPWVYRFVVAAAALAVPDNYWPLPTYRDMLFIK
jgi:hypothetical protein